MRFSLAVSLLGIPSLAVAAENPSPVGKVRYILGEVTIQKNAKNNWNPLRIGLKVRENDLIRTLVESEAGIALSDGSLVTIEENTTILFETAVNNQNEKVTSVDLQKGRVFFDVQKQSNGNSFQFKTGTATAAIRGTNGFVESGEEGIIVSLESGKMLVTDEKGQTLEVNGGETLVQEKDQGLKKFKSPSSGSRGLAKEISSERNSGKIQIEKLEQKARKMDAENGKKADSLFKAEPCQFEQIPTKTSQTEISIAGTCRENVSVKINGIAANLTQGTFRLPLNWEKDSYGTKRIRIKCSIGNVEKLCKEAFIEYIKPTLNDDSAFIRIHKEQPLSMNSVNGLTVTGEFFSEDTSATVTVSIGNSKSKNLNERNANGHFSFTFSPEDSLINSEETIVKAVIQSSKKTFVDSAGISFPPKLHITESHSDKCLLQFELSGVRNGKVLVEESVDGVPVSKATFEKSASAAFPMLPGKHFYRIFAKDEKGGYSEDSGTFLCRQ